MSIDTKQGLIYEPQNEELRPLFNWLRKNKSLDGSDVYQDAVNIYEGLDMDLLEVKAVEKRKGPVLAHESV
ncbi:hypothetical protein FZC84_12055 [Rossellomorea vietnamensis]|uniref:Uncharacterized protein n=1 Tax=Rossellomorea vietnamensis TaxID=218284 RepID=A0A5D4MBW0_9BACI|nr:hypothetical protein [Rossellomorea vietnamensis]TYR99101.1 hypothetical protein FZC84_12055 [Rossellomorea vietnamensis]